MSSNFYVGTKTPLVSADDHCRSLKHGACRARGDRIDPLDILRPANSTRSPRLEPIRHGWMSP